MQLSNKSIRFGLVPEDVRQIFALWHKFFELLKPDTSFIQEISL